MPNPDVAKLIADNIHALPHPSGQPVRLAQFDTTTLPPALREQVTAEHQKTTTSLGEAIVHLIETNGNTIIPTAQLQALQVKANAFDGTRPPTAAVTCRRCNKPFMHINITNPDHIAVNDAEAFINALTAPCPHGAQ